MAYAAALGSKDVALIIPEIIGYFLTAYFFLICHIFMLVNCLIDEFGQTIEEKIFGEPVSRDINKTGGTIPTHIRTTEDFCSLLQDGKKTHQEYSKKTY